MNKSSYSLLYNQLWIVNEDKLKVLNPDYSMPVRASLKPSMTNPVASEIIAPIPVRQVVKPEPLPGLSTTLIPDWDNLINQISNCTLCGLCAGRKNVVIERGSRTARWMFIGEGPGEQEDMQGKPFVGNSGQLLNKMIAAMQLDKDNDVYICNVVKCRPPYNRNPELEEINACNNYLLSQIELVRPKIIIALGRFASQTLLNSSMAIGKLRKQVHQFNEIPLIVTYHPSYLLRNPNAKKDAWDDLQLALKVYQHHAQ